MRAKATIGIRMAAAGCAALAAVWLLSMLPSPEGAGRDRAVFRSQQPSLLTQRSLVDGISELSFNERLTRVEWSGSVLKIDLEAEIGARGQTDWIEDIRRLAEFSFVQNVNVSRLLVRFENSEDSLLAASDIRRNDAWLDAESLRDWSGVHPTLDPLWRSRLRLTFVGEWADGANRGGM